jgi:DNA modification methylase
MRAGIKKDRMSELSMHPTVKPVAMIMDAIKDGSKAREMVLDGFGGSAQR